MNSKMKALLLLIVIISLFMINVEAVVKPKTNSYTYSTSNGNVTTLVGPMPFLPSQVIDFDNLAGGIQNPIEMCFDSDKNLYIVDSVGNKIAILSTDFQVKKAVSEFYNNGKVDGFKTPSDIFITKSKLVYICDTNNNRVVVLDSAFKLVKIYTAPKSELLGKNYIFKPLKIAVDISGNMYIINQNEFNGILQLDNNGSFINFIGSNKVVYNPIDAFWKSIMTNAQRQKMLQFIPIEYSNISMDHEGFIYAVSSSKKESSPIKRLNLSGQDVLVRNGYVGVVGDIDTVNIDSAKKAQSSFTDIVSTNEGIYFALDLTLGRIFAYNSDGFLLYVFGGLGNNAGLFNAPCAIEANGDQLLVLDQTGKSLTVFKMTDYAKLIEKADTEFKNGKYNDSLVAWNKVLHYNSNYELAYAQIGGVYLEQGKYEEAMKYFELGNYRGNKITLLDGYNSAFTNFRKVFAKNYLGIILFSGLIMVVAYFIIKRLFKKKKIKK